MYIGSARYRDATKSTLRILMARNDFVRALLHTFGVDDIVGNPPFIIVILLVCIAQHIHFLTQIQSHDDTPSVTGIDP